MNKDKLKKLLGAMSSFDSEVEDSFETLEGEMAKAAAKIKDAVTAKTLSEVSSQFQKLEGLMGPVMEAFETFKSNLDKRDQKLTTYIKSREEQLSEMIQGAQDNFLDRKIEFDYIASLIKKDIQEFSQIKAKEDTTLSKNFEALVEGVKTLTDKYKKLENTSSENIEAIKKLDPKKIIETLEKKIEDVRGIALTQPRGGNMNRQIRVEGVDVLTRYTDINFVGTTSSVLTSVDNTNKRTNIIFPSGSSSGSVTVMVPVGTINDVNLIFAFPSAPTIVVVNGASYREGRGFSLAGSTVTLDYPVGTGGDIYGLA